MESLLTLPRICYNIKAGVLESEESQIRGIREEKMLGIVSPADGSIMYRMQTAKTKKIYLDVGV